MAEPDSGLFCTVGCHPTRCNEFLEDAEAYVSGLWARVGHKGPQCMPSLTSRWPVYSSARQIHLGVTGSYRRGRLAGSRRGGVWPGLRPRGVLPAGRAAVWETSPHTCLMHARQYSGRRLPGLTTCVPTAPGCSPIQLAPHPAVIYMGLHRILLAC